MSDDKLQVRKAAATAIAEPVAVPASARAVEDLVAGTMAQLRGALDSSQVIGEPIRLGDTTVIPLLSVGFGFGAGRGDAQVVGKNGGQVGVGAGGGGVRPIAMVIAGPDGVRIEPVALSTTGSALDRLATAVEEKMAKSDKSTEKSTEK